MTDWFSRWLLVSSCELSSPNSLEGEIVGTGSNTPLSCGASDGKATPVEVMIKQIDNTKRRIMMSLPILRKDGDVDSIEFIGYSFQETLQMILLLEMPLEKRRYFGVLAEMARCPL